jgi:hypothetical protein
MLASLFSPDPGSASVREIVWVLVLVVIDGGNGPELPL